MAKRQRVQTPTDRYNICPECNNDKMERTGVIIRGRRMRILWACPECGRYFDKRLHPVEVNRN